MQCIERKQFDRQGKIKTSYTIHGTLIFSQTSVSTTQYNKLGATLGNWLKKVFEPALYNGMKSKSWDMCPYVDFGSEGPDKGMEQFYDPPRYSSGYAALWQCIAFVPETHMLKPYKDRVLATYAFMQTIMEQAAKYATALIEAKKDERASVKKQLVFPLGWKVDSSKYSYIEFKGYEQAFKPSDATGLQRMYYDHSKPYTKKVQFFDWFVGQNEIVVPKFYVIPQGWYSVIDILKINGVQMHRSAKDSLVTVQAYHIDDYKTSPRPYEKHHKNSDVKTTLTTQKILFLKGDFLIATDQPAKRYLVEMLEPTGDDSFFAWNFFDGVLQQKEGYSDYRWDDVAAGVLKNNPQIKLELEEKKRIDTAFAANGAAQLNWIYKKSFYYEPAHLRYPVYRIL